MSGKCLNLVKKQHCNWNCCRYFINIQTFIAFLFHCIVLLQIEIASAFLLPISIELLKKQKTFIYLVDITSVR